MNSIGFSHQPITTLHSLQPIAASPVGEESLELKESSLKPVEQAAQSAQTPESRPSPQAIYERASEQAQQQAREQEKIDEQTLKRLATLDREVRNHEQAHAAVGGQYAGAPRYEYERGPDGVNYAVAGEVPISTSAISGDPERTIEKAQVVRRAALAPAEPSPQDRRVAAEASQLEATARVELAELEKQERLEEERLDEARREEDATVTQQSPESINGVDENTPTEQLNHTQEEVFNEINQALTEQLVALGATQQAPRSLGSIINQLI